MQGRIATAEVLFDRERWMLARLPGGAPATLGLSLLVAVGVAALRPDLGELTLLTGAALLALLGVALLSQSSGLLLAVIVAPVALLLPRDAVLVPRVVAAVGLLLLIVAIPRAQRWFAVLLLDSPRGRDAGPAGLALASGVTVGMLVTLWGFVIPPMVLGAAITDPADLTMSPLPVLALGFVAAGLGFAVALTVQTRAGVAPDAPLFAGPVGLDREGGNPRLIDPTDDQVRDQLRHLASTLGGIGLTGLNAEAVAVASVCPPDGDRDAAPRIQELLGQPAGTGTDLTADQATTRPTTMPSTAMSAGENHERRGGAMGAATDPSATTSMWGGLTAWWRADRGPVLQLAGLLAALVSFVFLWPSLLRVGGWEPLLGNIVIHVYVAVWLLAASAYTRSIGLRDVVIAWLMGTFLVPTLVFVPGIPVRNWLGDTSAVMAVYWAPLLEETALLLVLGILVLRLTRRAGRAPGPMDLLILGFAVGGGYGVHEDALYGRLLASFPETTLGPAFEATYGWIWPVFSDSDVTVGGESMVLYTYHAGHGAYFGVLFAIVLMVFHRWRPIVWLLPLGWAYAVVEHGLANLMVSDGLHPLRWVFLNGHVIAVLLVLAVPTFLAIELWARRRTELTAPPMSRDALRRAMDASIGPVDLLTRLHAGLRYHRARNAVLYDAARRPEPRAAQLRPLEAWARLLVEGRQALPARGASSALDPTGTNGTPPPAPQPTGHSGSPPPNPVHTSPRGPGGAPPSGPAPQPPGVPPPPAG